MVCFAVLISYFVIASTNYSKKKTFYLIEYIIKCEYMWYSCKYKCVCFTQISTEYYINFDWSRLKTCLEILVSAKIPFVNLNLSRISAETKISDLSKISAEIWLRHETFCESGPSTYQLVKILHCKVLGIATTLYQLSHIGYGV